MSKEQVSTPNPEDIKSRKQSIADKIIELSQGGEVQANKVVKGVVKIPNGELRAYRLDSGKVAKIEMTEQRDDGDTTTEVDQASLGIPREVVSQVSLGHDGQTRKVNAVIGTTIGANHGELDGTASQWPSDRSESGSEVELSPDQSAAVVSTALDMMEQQVQKVEASTTRHKV